MGSKNSKNRAELTGNGEAAKAPFLLEGLGLANGQVAVDDDGVEDEAVLVALDLADHVGLGLGGAVVVDDAEAALESHVDGHLVLGDGVHGGRDEGRLEGDALRDGRVERDLGGGEANVSRQQQEVIVRQTAVLGRVHELVDVEPIEPLVLGQDLEGLGVVQDLEALVDGSGSHCETRGGREEG